MDAWLSPRWGGIAILNPPVEICTTGESGEFRPSSEKAMAVFALQLRQLIGIADKVDKDDLLKTLVTFRCHLYIIEFDCLFSGTYSFCSNE